MLNVRQSAGSLRMSPGHVRNVSGEEENPPLDASSCRIRTMDSA